ncbi:MAG: RagB/SusD family nutrient uptake outer membrane protein [Chitinophagaceae bacterium]|nr:RagB/SusD family nutrient uptake outer membrane protein [Chitinophagaceae bacterium]
MKTNNKLFITILAGSMIFGACKESFLEIPPQGVYDEASLSNKKGLNGMLINAYATLDGQEGTWYAGASNWVWGSVAGGDAYKGSEESDQVDVNPVVRFVHQPSNPIILNKWNGTYDGIRQANLVLRILPNVTDITAGEATQIGAEARFLRGHHHFEGKKMWKNIPYVDETVTDFKIPNTSGADYVNIWPQIEADLKYAYDNLDETKPNAGRINKWGAAAYLAKAYMFQKKFTEAKALYDLIIANGKTTKGDKYGLMDNYGGNFRVTSENNKETIFAIQSSYGDGSNTNGNYDNALNFPHNSGPKPGGCCGFFQPSQSFVNSFKTDAGGLPTPTTFNATNVTSDELVTSAAPFVPYAGTLDPRLDWSVGRRSVPYYDWGVHPGRDWIRDVIFGGPYSPKKNTYYRADQGTTAGVVGWGWANTALNYTIMRFADVLLMAAEAEIEVGSLATATNYVNMVRTRAKNSPVLNGAVDAANYLVNTYPVFGSQAAGRTAVRFERKLELGMEGHRFFDLVRWEIADTEINPYLTIEGTRRPGPLAGATFVKGKHEYFPIPDFVISQSFKDGAATIKQNPGY